MRNLLSFKGEIAPPKFAIYALALLLSQHLAVALVFKFSGWELSLSTDGIFWFLPLRRLAAMPGLPAWASAFGFTYSLAVASGLAVLSFRRATWSRGGYALVALAIVPAVQFFAVAFLACLPRRPVDPESEPETGTNVAHITQGVLAGIAIIILAVLISAVALGSYGWGLFVLTPFLVGITTAYLANRRMMLSQERTVFLVMMAALLGALALVMLALEGIGCIILSTPLAAFVAWLGGLLGRAIAQMGKKRERPLMSLAVLPAVFVLEAALPPALPIEMHEVIEIAAPPSAVWQALLSSDPIQASPGVVGWAGLAYPIRSRLTGEGVGAERLGEFSTGIARERVTEWVPEQRFAFAVLTQPPAMDEMSPYREVHAPHINGYFETTGTSFDLEPLPHGGTRLTARASHVLRIDPVLYWEPLARLAIHLNVSRVLRDIEAKAVGQ